MAGGDMGAMSCMDLKNECEELYATIVKLQADGLSKAQHKQLVTEVNDDVAANIRVMKKKMLLAEAAVLATKNPEGLPKDPRAVNALLKEDLQRTIAELRELKSRKKAERIQLEEQIEREKIHLAENKQVNAAVILKLRETKEGSEAHTERAYLNDLEKKQEKAKAYYKQMLRSLMAFIDTNYAGPSKDQIDKWRSKRDRKQRQQEDIQFMPLQDMLERLMNTSFDTPHDPYIDVAGNLWPPHIELLLRCGIVTSHPQDDRKIRLVPTNT